MPRRHALDILYVITDLEIGGVPLHLRRLAGHARDQGKSVKVASLAPPGPVAEMLREEGIDVASCHARGGWDVRVLFRLARLIRRHSPSLIHALLFHANLASRLAGRWTGFPANRILCEIQTVEIERRWHLWVDRWTWPLSRLTVGNSPSVIDHLHHHARIPSSRLRLIRGGIDVESIRAATPHARSSIGVSEHDRLILWVGRLDPIKGLDVLIQALAGLVEEFPTARLVLVGPGPLEGSLKALAQASGVADRVHFLGARRDVPSLLKMADAFAFPSRTEGLPNSLLEAMAAGLPILTTDAPGCRDLIEPEVSGVVVPPGDATALREGLGRLLRNPAWAKRLGARAFEEVSTRRRREDMLDAYMALYREIEDS